MIKYLSLAVGLGMISAAGDELCPLVAEKFISEVTYKDRIVIEYQCGWDAMKTSYVAMKNPSYQWHDKVR